MVYGQREEEEEEKQPYYYRDISLELENELLYSCCILSILSSCNAAVDGLVYMLDAVTIVRRDQMLK